MSGDAGLSYVISIKTTSEAVPTRWQVRTKVLAYTRMAFGSECICPLESEAEDEVEK